MPSKLQSVLAKAALVGATGAVLSVIVLNGTQSVPIAGLFLPKAIAQGGILAFSSVATSYITPAVVPWVSAGSGQLKTFELLVLEPLILGTVSLLTESIIAPGAEVVGQGGTLKTVFVGGAASVTAAYISVGLGWSSPEV